MISFSVCTIFSDPMYTPCLHPFFVLFSSVSEGLHFCTISGVSYIKILCILSARTGTPMRMAHVGLTLPVKLQFRPFSVQLEPLTQNEANESPYRNLDHILFPVTYPPFLAFIVALCLRRYSRLSQNSPAPQLPSLRPECPKQ
jgi:hypothetical protein